LFLVVFADDYDLLFTGQVIQFSLTEDTGHVVDGMFKKCKMR
jgi:hypothetical protein